MAHPTGVTAGVVAAAAQARRGVPRGRWSGFADTLAGRMQGLGAGARADLRRIDERRYACPVFWQIAGDLAIRYELWPGTGPRYPADERKLIICAGALARLMERGRHTEAVPFGRALYHLGCSDIQFASLLRAQDDALLRQVLRLCHDLSVARRGADFADALRLVWAEDWEAEQIRSKMAMDFYVRPSPPPPSPAAF